MKNIFSPLFTGNKKLTTDQLIVKKTLVSFFFFFIFIAAAIASWKWLLHQPADSGARRPLRYVLNKNDKIFSGIFSNKHLVKEFPLSKAVNRVRVNGNYGMGADFDGATWNLNVIKINGDTLKLTLDDIKKLPKTEIIFDFKCIEGWSQVTHWGGVKFSDFIKAYGLSTESAMKYVGMVTPDLGYYVGIDMPSALHPQTLLCYEMNDKPLPMNQGYPLRLIIPVKYGVKSIKRIGTMHFQDQRPPDYWAERGYDYYIGL